MTNQNVEIERFVAGEDLLEGDFLKLDASGNAVKATAAEATNLIGVAYEPADSGKPVPVVVRGKYKTWCLVQDTDGSAGYDAAIVPGAQLLVGGKSGGDRGLGQALCAFGGSDQVATANLGQLVVAKALEAEAGSISADTYSKLDCYLSFM